MKDYTNYLIEITIKDGLYFCRNMKKNNADLIIQGGTTSVDNILSFSDDCKKIVKTMRKAIKAGKSNCYITIHFNRSEYREETDSIINVRSASNTMNAIDLLENGGMYLIDDHHFSNADFWLDLNADLLKAFKDFADYAEYWHNDIAL